MAFNLVDIINSQLGQQVTGQIGGILGADNQQTSTAISGAIPSLLGSLMNSASDGKGADVLAQALDDQDSGLLDNLGDMLSGDNQQSMLDMGGNLLNSLFGESKLSGLIGAISTFSGLGRGSAGSLLGLLMPVVMGVLGKQKRDLGLDGAGISKLLSDQKDNIMGAMPEGMTSALSATGMAKDLLGDLGSSVSAAQERAADMAGEGIEALQEAAKPRKSLLAKIIPLIVILIIAWIVWRYLIGTDMNETETTEPASQSTQQ